MRELFSRLYLIVAIIVGVSSSVLAQEPYLHIPKSPQAAKRVAPQAVLPAPSTLVAPTVENGRQCTTIDFEGVGDLAPIPVFDGIASPGWLGLIDSDAGGSGNFAREPSPETVAFWLGGNPGQRDIVMTNPASKVEFYYCSFVTVTMQALDEKGNVLATAIGGPNFNLGSGDPTGDFNRWDPLKVEVDGNKIKSVRVLGNTNQTGIDNLKICTTIGVAAAEMTQAIQQYQDLKDLKTSLQATREPPVPLIAGKPGVLRIFMDKVNSVTDVTVRLSGAVNQQKSVALQPQCTPDMQRRQTNGCQSIDFYFTPPEGNWNITAEVLDKDANVLESHSLPFRSRNTRTLALKGVSICDAKDAAGHWLCAPASALAGNLSLLRKISPTSSVTVQTTNSFVRREVSSFSTVDKWWSATIKDVDGLYRLFDSISDLFGNTSTTYYGMIRPALPGSTGGMAHSIPGRGAGSRTSVIRLGTETVAEVVPHEVGHTLGLRHTNTQVPAAAAAPPGCYNLAVDPATDWPFANNSIQSAKQLEVGFDVGAQRPLLPEVTFEVMSYCTPRWISPLRYKKAITALGGGAVRTASAVAAPSSPVPSEGSTPGSQDAFWTVSGTITNGLVLFDPLFDDGAQGSAEQGDGTHRIEVQDGPGAVLFTRLFTPSVPTSEAQNPAGEIEGPPGFFELVPVQAGAARIVVFDPANVVIGTLTLGGEKPVVSFSPPPSGVLSGQTAIAWGIVDPDSNSFTTRVYFSPDNGTTWSLTGAVVDKNSLLVDFSAIPGSNAAALVRLSVSDGVNTGSVTSAPFSVTKKVLKDVRIISPPSKRVFAPQSMIVFEAAAYDVDDGVLDGAAISWESSLDGTLGHGAFLALNSLSSGAHAITMRATDTDGNQASATTTIRIAGAAPTLDLTVTPLDTLPTTCVQATVDPKPEPGGVALSVAEYSLDGGQSWISIPLNSLPFKFIVPGSGFFHLIARAYDEAGQSAARDATFFVDSPCQPGGTPRLDGTIVNKGVAAPGVLAVDLMIKNNGDGEAKAIRIDAIRFRTLAGTGTVSLNSSLSPKLPITLPDLKAGQWTTLRLYVNRPASVTRFSISEDGSMQDKFGLPLKFSNTQAIIP